MIFNPLRHVPWASLVGQLVKNLPVMLKTWVWSLGKQDPLEKGNGTPLKYPCLENSMDRGAWWAAVHGVTKSQNDWAHTHMHDKNKWRGPTGYKWRHKNTLFQQLDDLFW